MAQNQTQKPNVHLQKAKRLNLAAHKSATEKRLSKYQQRLLNLELLNAARDGRTKDVKLLLDAGANIEARDETNWTPLMNAAREGHVETCKLLLERGADRKASDNIGWTPFKLARFNRHMGLGVFIISYPLMSIEESKTFLSEYNECAGDM